MSWPWMFSFTSVSMGEKEAGAKGFPFYSDVSA